MANLKLGDLVKIRTGKLDANASSTNGVFPFFTCSKQTLKIDSFSYDTECVLVAGNGDLNVKYFKGKFDAYQRTYIIESKDENILNTKYLYWFLFKYVEKLRELSIGGVIKYIKLNNLTDPIIPVPSIAEQKRIVSTIEKVDSLWEKRNTSSRLLDDYLISKFVELFGDLGNNSNGLIVDSLDNLAEVRSGVTKGRKLNDRTILDIPYMRVANVQDGFIDLKEVKTIEATPNDLVKYRLEVGDLLLTEGGDPDKLGRGGIWRGEIEDCIHQNHIFRVRFDQRLVTPEYASALISSPYGKRYFLKSAKQTTGIATINSTQLKKFPFLLPDINLQNQYAAIAEEVEVTRKCMEEQKLEVEILFNSLMQKEFKGSFENAK